MDALENRRYGVVYPGVPDPMVWYIWLSGAMDVIWVWYGSLDGGQVYPCHLDVHGVGVVYYAPLTIRYSYELL